jgi:hypothetical protein
MPALAIARPREVTVDVPVQYFQSVIALETAVAGVLLFQIRFFTTNKDAPEDSDVDPRLRVLLLLVLTATIFGSLEPGSAIRSTGPPCSASWCTG